MIDVITKATFIYFSTLDDKGLTRNMLRELYNMSTEMNLCFKYDEEQARYYIWVNNRILDDTEVSEITSKVVDICSGVEIQTDINNINLNTKEFTGGCTFERFLHESMGDDKDKPHSILNDREIEDLLSALSDGECDKEAIKVSFKEQSDS